MEYQPISTVSGGWVKKEELHNGQRCKIVSEVMKQPSPFKDEKTGAPIMQDVGKVHFQGQKEPVNCNFNRPSINAIISAFGTESKDWIGKELTVETEKVRVAGRASVALYLIPDGFKKVDDENGFAVIVRSGDAPKASTPVYDDTPPAIDVNDLPF